MQAAAAAWVAMLRERLGYGAMGFLATWLIRPLFPLTIAVLIYGGRHPALLRYAVVGVTANNFLFESIFFVGEILDEERTKGTLVGLFLAPAPRISWLTGFVLVGVVETMLAAATTVLFGTLIFGVRFHPDYGALLLAFVLFLVALWGMGLVFSAIGLALKRANDLSNLVSPFLTLLGGIYYPVALLPLWVQVPARALPLGYGVQAMASASLYHAGITQLGAQLLPLAGFAVALPFIGISAFRWIERNVRERGEIDVY